ncbi:unnamed protein product [Vicia faba]|uniref:Uncharacterized protein n=1 Tax=Vicia faba TaxID=3906 RepID=A0AAV1B0Q2_VICFA|nr:unnamed protein product [Vicia faba]
MTPDGLGRPPKPAHEELLENQQTEDDYVTDLLSVSQRIHLLDQETLKSDIIERGGPKAVAIVGRMVNEASSVAQYSRQRRNGLGSVCAGATVKEGGRGGGSGGYFSSGGRAMIDVGQRLMGVLQLMGLWKHGVMERWKHGVMKRWKEVFKSKPQRIGSEASTREEKGIQKMEEKTLIGVS